MFGSTSLRKQAEGMSDQFSRRITSLAGQARDNISGLASEQSKNSGWLTATLLAFGLGLAVGILTAPRTGRETREKLGERAKNVTDFMTRRESEMAAETEKMAAETAKEIASKLNR